MNYEILHSPILFVIKCYPIVNDSETFSKTRFSKRWLLTKVFKTLSKILYEVEVSRKMMIRQKVWFGVLTYISPTEIRTEVLNLFEFLPRLKGLIYTSNKSGPSGRCLYSLSVSCSRISIHFFHFFAILIWESFAKRVCDSISETQVAIPNTNHRVEWIST